MSLDERENEYIKEEKEEKNKNLLLTKLAPLAYLFSLGVIYASNIKNISKIILRIISLEVSGHNCVLEP